MIDRFLSVSDNRFGMVQSWSELLQEASNERDADMPVLYVLGDISQDVTPDGTVVKQYGEAHGSPVYKIQPRIWEVSGDNEIKITDDYTDWLDVNDEVTTISGDLIETVLVANPNNEEGFATRDASYKVIMCPPPQ
jgi:hypothetical protein